MHGDAGTAALQSSLAETWVAHYVSSSDAASDRTYLDGIMLLLRTHFVGCTNTGYHLYAVAPSDVPNLDIGHPAYGDRKTYGDPWAPAADEIVRLGPDEARRQSYLHFAQNAVRGIEEKRDTGLVGFYRDLSNAVHRRPIEWAILLHDIKVRRYIFLLVSFSLYARLMYATNKL